MRALVLVSRRRLVIPPKVFGLPRAVYPHLSFGPRITLSKRDVPRIGGIVKVLCPVMHLELNPCSGKQVDDRRRLEAVVGSRKDLLRDQPRVGFKQLLVRRGRRVLPWHVAPESHASATHFGAVEIVELAV